MRMHADFAEFLVRVGLLAGLAGLVALVELLIKRKRARRWREYAFVFACATLAAVLGVGVDCVTFGISPEYFFIGKQIPHEAGSVVRILQLGGQAGFIAGAALGGILLVANSVWETIPPLPAKRLMLPIIAVVVLSVLTAFGGSVYMAIIEPPRFIARGVGPLAPDRLARVSLVWGIHLGLYCGAIVGTVAACAHVMRVRLANVPSLPWTSRRLRDGL